MFSILRPGRTAGLMFTLYCSNDVFSRNDGPFGVRMMGDVILGKHVQLLLKLGVNRQYKAKRRNIHIAISPK